HCAPPPFPTRRSSDLILRMLPNKGRDRPQKVASATPRRANVDKRLREGRDLSPVRCGPRTGGVSHHCARRISRRTQVRVEQGEIDRKSTRLNSSHEWI